MKLRNYVLAALGLILVLALFSLAKQQPASLQARVQQDLAVEKSRFLPENSVDIAQAMKIITFDEPRLLNPATPPPPQLMYPPSAETLERLSGV